MDAKKGIVIVGGSVNQGGRKVQKGVANYIGAAIEEFSRGATEVMLRARGKAISLAVDTAQKLNRLPGYAVDENARVGTETVGQKSDKVSFIEIIVRRKEV